MRSLPFAFAHIEVIVAGGTTPIHTARGLPGQESAVLPAILSRRGASPPMQAMDHGRGDAPRFENDTWQRFRQQARGAAGLLRCLSPLRPFPALRPDRVQP